jgi:hypothetical protein
MTTFGKIVSTVLILIILTLIIVVLKPFKSLTLGTSVATTTSPINVSPVETDALTGTYTNASTSYTLKYPAGYKIEERYVYQSLGPGKDIVGTKFIVPSSRATSTNLSLDSYISVESIPQTATCTPALFFDDEVTAQAMTENGINYLVASSTGAAAGNRYEETIYVLGAAPSCVAVRYFIHYGVIENYPEGSVSEFDKGALLKEFDQIRKSLVLNQ